MKSWGVASPPATPRSVNGDQVAFEWRWGFLFPDLDFDRGIADTPGGACFGQHSVCIPGGRDLYVVLSGELESVACLTGYYVFRSEHSGIRW